MSEPLAEYHFKRKEDKIQIPIPGAAAFRRMNEVDLGQSRKRSDRGASRMMNGIDREAPRIRFLVEGFTL